MTAINNKPQFANNFNFSTFVILTISIIFALLIGEVYMDMVLTFMQPIINQILYGEGFLIDLGTVWLLFLSMEFILEFKL